MCIVGGVVTRHHAMRRISDTCERGSSGGFLNFVVCITHGFTTAPQDCDK